MKVTFTAFTLVFLFCAMVQAQSPPEHGTFFFTFRDNERAASSQGVSVAREKLKMRPHEELQFSKRTTDRYGVVHERYQQMYRGIPVDHGLVIIHSKNGIISSINGQYYSVASDVETAPALSEEAAFEKAKQHMHAGEYKKREKDEKGELVIFMGTLAWKHVVRAADVPEAYTVYTDAHSGDELARHSLVHSLCKPAHAVPVSAGNADTRYSGQQVLQTSYDNSKGGYILKDSLRNIRTRFGLNASSATDLVDTDNQWSAAEYHNNKYDALLDLHWGMQVTYDYFVSKHSHQGMDMKGGIVNGYLYPIGTGIGEATWYGGIYFGDGDATTDPWTSVDLVAHEYGHGVCAATAELVYEKEYGALNESLSDIWGMCLDYHVNQQYGLTKNPWVNGEDFYYGGDYRRSFSNPKAKNLPDTYKGQYWIDPFATSSDNGGVHTNSAVMNHWFYLLAQNIDPVTSGTNDNNYSYSVVPIGIEDAAKIVYLAESQYLTPYSEYIDAYYAMVQAATDIFGANSFQVQQVTEAWHAVGVPFQYCNVSSTTSDQAWIASTEVVGVFNQNQNTNTPSGYSNYNADPNYTFNAVKGQTYVVNLTPNLSGLPPSTSVRWKVWLDKNTNGTYEASEEIFSSTGVPVSFSYTFSSVDKVGTGSMRVKLEADPNMAMSACGNISIGETEDYKVVVHPASCDAPVNFQVLADQPGVEDYTITWSDPNDIGYYEVFYSIPYASPLTPGNAVEQTIFVKNQNSAVLHNIGYSKGSTVTYRVRSICPSGASNWSADQTFTIPCTNGSPYGLKVDVLTDVSATFSWQDPLYNAAVDTYVIWMTNLSFGKNVTQLSDTENNLTPGTTYTIWVQKKGCNITAGPLTFTTLCPSAPTSVAFNTITETTADISWTDPKGIGNYVVAFRVLGDSLWQYKNVFSAQGIQLDQLLPATGYEMMVARVCASGNLRWTSVNTFFTLCPSPSSLAVTNLSAYSVTLTWNPANTVSLYKVWYRMVNSAWSTTTTSANSVTLSVVPGSYEAYVQSVCGNQVSYYANHVFFQPDYCASSGTVNFEWIDYVSLESLVNSSWSNNGYGNYTALVPPNIYRGESYNIILSAGGAAGNQLRTKYWHVWIDYNRDGDFGDFGEQVISFSSSSLGYISSTFSVPYVGTVGLTRMRVSMRYGSYPSSCGAFSDGEVEDYTVNVVDPNGPVEARQRFVEEAIPTEVSPEPSNIGVYPNPVKNVLTIRGIGNDLIRITNLMGQEMYQGILKEHLDVGSWPAGTYILQVQGRDGTRRIKFVKN